MWRCLVFLGSVPAPRLFRHCCPFVSLDFRKLWAKSCSKNKRFISLRTHPPISHLSRSHAWQIQGICYRIRITTLKRMFFKYRIGQSPSYSPLRLVTDDTKKFLLHRQKFIMLCLTLPRCIIITQSGKFRGVSRFALYRPTGVCQVAESL